MTFIAKRLKSRFYWLGMLLIISGQIEELRPLLAEWYGVASVVLSLIIFTLREDTTKAVSDK